MRGKQALIMVACVGVAAIAAAEQVLPRQDADTIAIRKAAIDYAEGWYQGDAARMERALHPDLAKRIAVTDPNTKRSRLDGMSALKLVQATRKGWGKRTPANQRIKQVTILDRFGNAASVKLVMKDWIDYMHVAKYNGEWKIVNVLWERKPKRR